jgi:fructokinase
LVDLSSGRVTGARIACIGEVLWDKLPGGARLGGATANFAVFGARLGNCVSLISSLGGDEYGRQAREILSGPYLDLDNLQTSPEHPTGTVEVALSAGGQPSYTISPGAAWDFIQWTPSLLEIAATADAFYFGTLSQRHGVSGETIRKSVRATRVSCVRICDVNLRMPFCSSEILAWSMGQASIIKISDEELTTVFALLKELKPQISRHPLYPEQAAAFLLEHFPGCNLVALTLGSQGCLLVARNEAHRHPGFPVTLVDPVGAGDAFTAGLMHAYLRGAPLAVMAEVANLCGSFVASQPGATPELPVALTQRISNLLDSEPAATRDAAMA